MTQTAEDRFKIWNVLLNELETLDNPSMLARYALRGIISQTGSDMAYLKTVIKQRFPTRHALNDEQYQLFKRQLSYCKIVITMYNRATKLNSFWGTYG